MNVITSNTLVPLGLALGVIGGVAGWATKSDMQTAENSKAIDQALHKFEDIDRKLYEILDRIGKIEGQLRRQK